MSNEKDTKNVFVNLAITVFFVFTVVFYGPLSVYLPNAGDFWFGLDIAMKVIIPVSLAAFIAVMGFLTIVPGKAKGFFQKLAFGGSLGFYVQGTFLPGDYGVLDGATIHWGEYKGRIAVSLVIWLICIALPFVVDILLKEKISVKKVILYGSLFLTAIQIPAMVSQFLTYQPGENNDLQISKSGIYDVYDEENVFLFILDTMDEAYYEAFLEEHPDFTESLEGFVSYDNTLSSGARTIIGIPSMLSGKPFKREEKYTDYVKGIWSEENVFSLAHDQGYTVSIYSESQPFSSEASEYVDNFKKGQAADISYRILAVKLYKLDLFKYMPDLLKRFTVVDTAEFQDARKSYSLNDISFFNNYRKKGYKVKEGKGIKVYHLLGAHTKWVMGEDGQASENATRETQITGSLYSVLEMLQGLKDKDLYDKSTIIITADHGDEYIAHHPFLLIKDKGATGQYKVSHIPASLFDIPTYIAESIGVSLSNQAYGVSFSTLSEDKPRERYAYYNTSGSSRVVIEEYVTTSTADDWDALKLLTSYEDESGLDTPYYLGTELSFKVDATGNRYVVDGFTENTGYRTALHGPHSIMRIPIADLPEEGTLVVTIGLHRLTKRGKDLHVIVNGTEVYSVVTDDELVDNGIEFEFPVDLIGDDGILEIDFSFPEIKEKQMKKPVEQRKETLSFQDMTISIKE